jgi:hypothetical protein
LEVNRCTHTNASGAEHGISAIRLSEVTTTMITWNGKEITPDTAFIVIAKRAGEVLTSYLQCETFQGLRKVIVRAIRSAELDERSQQDFNPPRLRRDGQSLTLSEFRVKVDLFTTEQVYSMALTCCLNQNQEDEQGDRHYVLIIQQATLQKIRPVEAVYKVAKS